MGKEIGYSGFGCVLVFLVLLKNVLSLLLFNVVSVLLVFFIFLFSWLVVIFMGFGI